LRRLAALLLAGAAALAAPPAPIPPHEYVQAVEFPYYSYPRALWERELVWLKNIGVHTVEFSIPWNWHQIQPGDFDFTGRTSPRRDLVGLIHILRRLDLQAWVNPLPLDGWPANNPLRVEGRAEQAWLHALDSLLASQTVSHGGPILLVDGRALSIDAAHPPVPVTVVSTSDPEALAISRRAFATGLPGALLWKDVEDTLPPAGWSTNLADVLHKGAVGLSGDERPAAVALRRHAALLRNWAAMREALHRVALPKPPEGKLPEGVSMAELVSPAASAVSISNRGQQPFHDGVHVFEPESKRTLVIPGVTVLAGDSLWLPLDVSVGPNGLCHECSNFSGAEHIVYATAELLSVEFENGILAMEFAAPEAAEVVMQLARKPVGPYLAAGRPMEFEWDDKALRARLPIPANPAAGNRVRIGIGIEEPETSAFFNDARRLIIGQKNVVSTSYSSAELAVRSRLRLPEGYTAAPTVKSPDDIDYEVSVPSNALHGDYAALALEADGMPLGRARLQLFRPVSLRLMEAMQIHWGSETELTPDPPTATIEPKAGTDLELSVRNNWPSIQSYVLQASGDGLEFFPPKTEVVVGAIEERRIPLRVFAKEGVAGLRAWKLKVTGAATMDMPMRVVLIPRGQTVAWSADLDGDGSPEWVLETQKVRAVFSAQDGGRWMEFNWKDTNLNYLPEQGAFAARGPVQVHAAGDALEFSGPGWKRTVRLSGTTLTFEQTTPLPSDGLTQDRRGNIDFKIVHPAPERAVYSLENRQN
jgi:hypothetical protein